MITTGIIREIGINKGSFTSNAYKVELNIFQIPGDFNKNNYTYISNCCTIPGAYDSYVIGDVVYVGFLNNNKSFPIILGKIYQGLEDKSGSKFNLNSLNVTGDTKLSKKTKIGDINYEDLKKLIAELELIKDTLDNLTLDNLDLDDLQDVTVDTPLDGHVLRYDETSQQFVNTHLPASDIAFDNTSTEMSATTVQEAIDEIDNVLDNLTFETSTSIETVDWVVDEVTAAYKAEIAVGGILATDSPTIIYSLNGIADTEWTAYRTEFAKIGLAIATENMITFYASAALTKDINIKIKVVR